MNFVQSLFKKTDEKMESYADFWNWFTKYEEDFFKVVKNQGNIDKRFFDKISPKLDQLREGFFFLTGMSDEDTVELIITAEGKVKNFVFVEELINAAPTLKGWKFTAHKPALAKDSVGIRMSDYEFSSDNLSFYPNEHADYPDLIDITVVHQELNSRNESTIANGVHIFLDNYLGEIDFATHIDELNVVGKTEAQKDPIPLNKLKDYLIWRQKEFVEKCEGMRYNTENDNFSMLEAQLENGKPLLAVVNRDLLEWDSKSSHPWILQIDLKYVSRDKSGMPDEETYSLLETVEDTILRELKDYEGYLNIGRQTADSVREIYFACKDFRKPSKVIEGVKRDYSEYLDISFDLYKDKYWRSFNWFRK